MRVYIIKASADGPFKEYKRAMGAPPQGIFSLAAAMPDGFDVAICDETIGMKPRLRDKADLVFIFFHTPDALHAYKLADQFKKNGKKVVFGGIHPSFMRDEALCHGDSVIVGESEGIIDELLEDFVTGGLKKIYDGSSSLNLPDLSRLNPFPTDIIKPSKYNYFWSVVVSRGCPHKCEFCAVHPFFNGKYRFRPVEEIVKEIQALPKYCWVELHADNLTANRKYALELFNALKPLGIKWAGEATIGLADDEELLKAAAESGCRSLLIGIETPSGDALKKSGKGFVSPDQVRDKIRKFHEYGISIISSMIFGFDSHTKDIFKQSADFCRYIEIDEVEAVVLIPFPGTKLFERLKSEGRILHEDWSRYDGSNVVFKPLNMTSKELYDGATWFWYEMSRKRKKSKSYKDDGGDSGSSLNDGPRLTTGGIWSYRWKSLFALFIICLFVGVLTLFFSPVGYVHADSSDKESVYVNQGNKAEVIIQTKDIKKVNLSDKPDKAGSIKTAGSEIYGVSIDLPDDWKVERVKEKSSEIINCTAKENRGALSIVCIDMKYKVKLSEFIDSMEDEFEKEMPFINWREAFDIRSGSKKSDGKKGKAKAVSEFMLRRYSGKLDGIRLEALSNFMMNKNTGCVVIGIYGAEDKEFKQLLTKAVTSPQLGKNWGAQNVR